MLLRADAMRRLAGYSVLVCAALHARGARASGVLTPPEIVTRSEAPYPPDALRERIEGSVGLELDVDAQGHVTGARVVTPAGHGFDERALEAVKQIVFVPAKRDGAAIPATIDFTYEFHLPPAPRVVRHDARKPEITQTGDDQSTVVLAERAERAASAETLRDRDFALRPIASVQDVLRATPGLVVVQHSGGGKANQYFLRGFDADHGTDIAMSIDGVPINMPTHAHGQGYADTNFIIPEVVERIEITKGPYFVDQGDFATAGAINLVSRDAFEHSSVGLSFGGSPGHGEPSTRVLGIASPHFGDSIRATFAVDVGRENGPFENPNDWNRLKLCSKLTWAITPRQSLSLSEMSYAGKWYGSGQIPERAVTEGLVSRFGSIDPDEGGSSARHQFALQYRLRPNEKSELRALAYAGAYDFDLFSNFTLYERDQENGDEIEQVDHRAFFGGKASYRVAETLRRVRFETTIGADIRADEIHNELLHTAHRSPLQTLRDDHVHEMLIGAYANERVSPVSWLRLDVGARADVLSFSVDGGSDGAAQFSPKMSAMLVPLERRDARVEIFANYGNGYHSNDVRGATQVAGAGPATPLTRAIGEELGARTRLFGRWDLTAAFWMLDLANETVWNGDEGTTAVAGATNRKGIELETRLDLTKWLSADLNVTFTESAFTADPGNQGLALAPKQTWAGGVSARHALGPGVARAGIRFFGIGDRPASDDGAITVPGWTQFDVHVGYRHRRFDVALDIENLFDAQFESAAFDTISRLRTEPNIGAALPRGFSCGPNARLATGPSAGRFYGCEGVDFTPAFPFSARITGTVYLD